MADTRPADDPIDAIAAMQQQITDLQTTMLARANRCPTGTMEITFLPAAKADTLLLDGSTKQRADYPALVQWASDNGLLGVTGLFGNGDGSTTFVLPDLRGQVLRMPAAGGATGEKLGADSITLTTNQLPAHNHTATTASAGAHDHGGTIPSAGAHNGHNAGATTVASALPGSQDFFFSVATTTQNSLGSHTHSISSDGAHTHTVTVNNTGTGAAVDNRQASIGVNVLIWT